MDAVSLTSLIVSGVALIISGLALIQDRVLAHNPVVYAEFNKHSGVTESTVNSATIGSRDMTVRFRVSGTGAAYEPVVHLTDEAEGATRKIKWAVVELDRILSADKGAIELFIEAIVSEPGVYVVFTFDSPRWIFRGTRPVHFRFPVPLHVGPEVSAVQAEEFKRGKWREVKGKSPRTPEFNPINVDRKLQKEFDA
ncbi:hypothetical protein CXR25_13965 [Brevibacterium aurantiacum]|uniref:hypothetical protein n=1 Tax=Brevibacterium aurantiacum TaxID=273384 RepID=UPI000F648F8E|nr:hypothetical protein [Brevibacterium aurantiacum]AZL13802.1 hypothetical protein CXR25_13965 [Brevibacterium aurantiacum]